MNLFLGYVFYIYKMNLTGILLAGGNSKRMGQDKALLNFNDSVLLDQSIDLLSQTCQEVIISSGDPRHNRTGVKRIDDIYPDCGPISGIYSCIRNSSNEWNLVLSVDSPFITKDFLEKMIQECDDRFDAIVPMHHKGKEPLIALYNSRITETMKSLILSSDYKMHFLLKRLKTKYFECSEWVNKHPRLFTNLNYPSDMADNMQGFGLS